MSLDDQMLVAQCAFFREAGSNKWLRKLTNTYGDRLIDKLLSVLGASHDDEDIQRELMTLAEILEILPNHHLTPRQYATCANAVGRVTDRTVNVVTPLSFLQPRTLPR